MLRRLILAVFLIVACGGESPGGTGGASLAGPGPFAGTYAVSIVSTTTQVAPESRSETGTSQGNLSITASSGGGMLVDIGDGCILTATRSTETAASVGSSQTCRLMGRNGALVLTLVTGSMSLVGPTLAGNLAWSFATEGTATRASGSISMQVNGTRR